MATGAGKTRSAIGAMSQANKLGLVEKTVVCVPKTLEEQWAKEIREHYHENDYDCYWWKSGKDDHMSFFMDRRKNSVMIVSYYFVPKLLEYIRRSPQSVGNTLLVVDEPSRRIRGVQTSPHITAQRFRRFNRRGTRSNFAIQ